MGQVTSIWPITRLTLSIPVLVLITRPLLSFTVLLTLSAVGMNLVTSPMTCLICGLADIVAPSCLLWPSGLGTSSVETSPFCPGRMILGGALSTLGLALARSGTATPGGAGTPGGADTPGGKRMRGRTPADKVQNCLYMTMTMTMK